jgi:hypothetical protein
MSKLLKSPLYDKNIWLIIESFLTDREKLSVVDFYTYAHFTQDINYNYNTIKALETRLYKIKDNKGIEKTNLYLILKYFSKELLESKFCGSLFRDYVIKNSRLIYKMFDDKDLIVDMYFMLFVKICSCLPESIEYFDLKKISNKVLASIVCILTGNFEPFVIIVEKYLEVINYRTSVEKYKDINFVNNDNYIFHNIFYVACISGDTRFVKYLYYKWPSLIVYEPVKHDRTSLNTIRRVLREAKTAINEDKIEVDNFINGKKYFKKFIIKKSNKVLITENNNINLFECFNLSNIVYRCNINYEIVNFLVEKNLIFHIHNFIVILPEFAANIILKQISIINISVLRNLYYMSSLDLIELILSDLTPYEISCLFESIALNVTLQQLIEFENNKICDFSNEAKLLNYKWDKQRDYYHSLLHNRDTYVVIYIIDKMSDVHGLTYLLQEFLVLLLCRRYDLSHNMPIIKALMRKLDICEVDGYLRSEFWIYVEKGEYNFKFEVMQKLAEFLNKILSKKAFHSFIKCQFVNSIPPQNNWYKNADLLIKLWGDNVRTYVVDTLDHWMVSTQLYFYLHSLISFEDFIRVNRYTSTRELRTSMEAFKKAFEDKLETKDFDINYAEKRLNKLLK